MNGKCQLLLDGMDEVKHTDLETFQLQLDALVDRYPQNQFVMSTRQFSSFVALSRFQLVWMLPFSLEQSLNLIDRLDFCPEEPKLKKEFRDKLEHEYINTHNAFVSNPLLLTLMLMNFRRFSDVPEKKYLFYQQAYETLLLRHDADKLAYRRVFHSVKDPADFTEVFREFCAKSYRHGDYEFDQKLFDDYFDKLHKKNEIVSDTMTADNFLKDILHSVCLMYEESHSYHFLHRSFQEYFFADYYCRQDDTTLRKLGEALSKPNQNVYDDGNGFEMLYELDHYKVEKFILQPFLQEIFDGKSTEEEKYLTFLEKGYSKLVYVYIDPEKTKKYSKIEKSLLEYSRVNVPATIILSFILKQCNVDAHFTIGNSNAKLQYPEFSTVYLFGQAFSRRKKENQITIVGIKKHLYDEIKKENNYRIIDDLVKDESGEYVVFGREYSLMFKDVIEKKDTYSALFDVLNQPSCEAYQKFVAVKDYYNKLVARIEKAEDVEDDDF